MTKTTFNEFGALMMENRPMMAQLDAEEMTRNEWKQYLKICDNVATTAFNFMATNNADNFPAFRSAVHALYAFVGADTRILAIDGYSVRFIPAVVPYKVVKSKEFKDAEKAIRLFKRAIEWACMESDANIENPEAVLFPKAVDLESFAGHYFASEVQDYYNLCVKFAKASFEEGHDLQLKTLNEELARLEAVKTKLSAEKWHFYKDFKNPMVSTGGKVLKHVPAGIRKNIEDMMADILSARTLMTVAQLEKEEAQIQGGKKQAKQAKAEANK